MAARAALRGADTHAPLVHWRSTYPGIRVSPLDTCVAKLPAYGGWAKPDAWLQARTSVRHDLGAAWIA
jgi:hypothetical protein